jgi:hypothetical protein
VGRLSRRASHLILGRSVTGEPRRRSEPKISLHKAASGVRYIVIFNSGSTTGSNGVSELGLAPHRAAVFATKLVLLSTKHPPAEVARKKSRAAVGCALVSPATRSRCRARVAVPVACSSLQSLMSRTTPTTKTYQFHTSRRESF